MRIYVKTMSDSGYKETRQALLDARDRLQAERQTAEAKLDQDTDDLHSNQAEVDAATDYLRRLGGSCDALLSHFDARVKLRSEERAAITQAIGVLSNS